MLDQKTVDRMVEAVLTSATCGEGCWYARETVCRCSCGGRNHGCLTEEGAERPVRTSKIDGVLYELASIGAYADVHRAARTVLKGKVKTAFSPTFAVDWGPTDPGSPVRVRAATKAQTSSWPELGATPDQYLLWKRADDKTIVFT